MPFTCQRTSCIRAPVFSRQRGRISHSSIGKHARPWRAPSHHPLPAIAISNPLVLLRVQLQKPSPPPDLSTSAINFHHHPLSNPRPQPYSKKFLGKLSCSFLKPPKCPPRPPTRSPPPRLPLPPARLPRKRTPARRPLLLAKRRSAPRLARKLTVLTSTRVCHFRPWMKAVCSNPHFATVLKQVHPDTGISNRAMSILNSFVNG